MSLSSIHRYSIINKMHKGENAMQETEIRVKVNGGYLVAGRNQDPEYDGIYIVFETDDGDVVDVVTTECKVNDKDKIDVYCYEDVYTEDFTKKYTLDSKEIYKAVNGEADYDSGSDELESKATTDSEKKLGNDELSLVENYTEDMDCVELAYEVYKKCWILENISANDFNTTFCQYENSNAPEDMTFREYIEEYGFTNGECYASLNEFTYNESLIWCLACGFETFLWERGEYDYPDDDTVIWINTENKLNGTARFDTVSGIVTRLSNGEISPIIDYLDIQEFAMDEEDELIDNIRNLLELAKSAKYFYDQHGTLSVSKLPNFTKAVNIQWDTDGDKELLDKLPKEIVIPPYLKSVEEVSEYISNYTGFSHFGFTIDFGK